MMGDREAVPGLLWIGRVKSTVAPAVLENAFGDFGKLKFVETGFAGFAFVQFHDADDAEEAVKKMNGAYITGVGNIHVSKATRRGYDEACVKRDAFRRQQNLPVYTRPSPTRSPIQSPRAMIRRLRQNRSSSSSGSRRSRRSRKSRSSKRSRARSDKSRSSVLIRRKRKPSRSRSKSKKRSPSRQKAHRSKTRSKSKTRGHSEEREVRYSRSRSDARDAAVLEKRSHSRGHPRENGFALVPYDRIFGETFGESPDLSGRDRSRVLCFFDGSSIRDLLLEALPLARAPELLNSSFPYAFSGLAQEESMEVLDISSEFAHPGEYPPPETQDGDQEERSIEIRQTLSIDSTGRRFLRKAIFVNGVRGSIEQLELQ